MHDDTVLNFTNPVLEPSDPLTDILRSGARQLLAQAIEAEVAAHMADVPNGGLFHLRTAFHRARNIFFVFHLKLNACKIYS